MIKNLSIASLSHNQTLQHLNKLGKTLQKLSSSNESLDELVKDKSQAVGKILGYGVDKEGYFTADFNEAAAIPKDFKINAQDALMIASTFLAHSAYFIIHTDIDLAKTYSNAYNAYNNKGYENSNPISNGANLTSFISYNPRQYVSSQSTMGGKIAGFDKNVSDKEIKDFKNFMEANKIQVTGIGASYENSWDFTGDALFLSIYVRASKTYSLGSDIINLAQSLRDEYVSLVNSNISLDEFKEKYLDFKQRHDGFVALYKEALNGAKISIDKDNNGNFNIKIQKDLNDEKKPFTPIQAESKSETFTYDDIAKNFFLTFLENERKKGTDILELLQNLFKIDKNKVDLKV
ncbi:hypothetical protein [uncultured Campylobacter sp.]|uniref:hypothetical protein n=1 Tax=uncultured Campylobacter sp. TaxID=218934 RepID=UPI0026177B2A|nr:hypothetical protein [uncultured Campylobacter sp.]